MTEITCPYKEVINSWLEGNLFGHCDEQLCSDDHAIFHRHCAASFCTLATEFMYVLFCFNTDSQSISNTIKYLES